MKNDPKKRIHLVCNAHLDPVWQWAWEDGLTEAISTFRVAADFCEQYENFVFNHNESLLYGWIAKHDPMLFKRIQQLVKQGRWHIAGGAFLQPDVNAPMGESHIRQFLLGLKFFTKHFNVRPTTAYNFDPFGHAEGFVQILAGCGMDSYIFCRPDHGTYDLPVGAFRWSDRSGASVTARRSDDHYLTRPNTVHGVEKKFPHALKHFEQEPVTMILWGIGNHGGGVSRAELKQVEQFIRDNPQYQFIHSTPEAFIKEILAQGAALPAVQGEMEQSFVGCYTSMSRVKRAHRAAEHLMLQTERLAAMAWWMGDAAYPAETLDACWRDILFCEFHDILPGSGVPRVEKDALAMMGSVHDRLRRLRFDTFSQIVRGERKAAEGEVPIFITNPHGFAVRQQVEFEYVVSCIGGNDKAIRLQRNGKDVPFQRISAEHNCGGQEVVRLSVPLELQPFEIRRLDATLIEGKPMLPQPLKLNAASLRLTSDHGTVQINPRTGLIDAITPKGSQRSLVRRGSMQPALFDDMDHSWTCGDPKQLVEKQTPWQTPWWKMLAWKKPDARFRLATNEEAATISPLACDKWGEPVSAKTGARPIRIVEHGEFRTTIEVLFVCESSVINRHYIFCRETGRLEVRDRVLFNHKDKMLKLVMPLGFKPDHSCSESLYSMVQRQPTPHYEDRHNQRWVAAVANDGAYLAVINDGSFAHCLTPDTLAINVMRSPAYTSFHICPNDPYNDHRFAARQDQGEHEVRYVVQWGNDLVERDLTQLADGLNAEPYAYVYYPDHHNYRRSKLAALRKPAVAVSSEGVRIVAIKRAEDSEALVVRLQEQAGRATRCRLTVAGQSVPVQLAAFGLTTLMLTRQGKRLICRPCNLVEGL